MSVIDFDDADSDNAADIAEYLWEVCQEMLDDGDPVIDVLLAVAGVMSTLGSIHQAMNERHLN